MMMYQSDFLCAWSTLVSIGVYLLLKDCYQGLNRCHQLTAHIHTWFCLSHKQTQKTQEACSSKHYFHVRITLHAALWSYNQNILMTCFFCECTTKTCIVVFTLDLCECSFFLWMLQRTGNRRPWSYCCSGSAPPQCPGRQCCSFLHSPTSHSSQRGLPRWRCRGMRKCGAMGGLGTMCVTMVLKTRTKIYNGMWWGCPLVL